MRLKSNAKLDSPHKTFLMISPNDAWQKIEMSENDTSKQTPQQKKNGIELNSYLFGCIPNPERVYAKFHLLPNADYLLLLLLWAREQTHFSFLSWQQRQGGKMYGIDLSAVSSQL